ncbi:DUF4238 domain-containing protein [Shewanella benthica]|uniref:DUF4238 domain-containing protein n=1 Tax=Shewanella benthica KT99 TaxID=314608 RepID=A9ELM9_9GAMM|nr:DUF4238 domain-containing protein [Shewanella benthica]EDP99388.1 hypothetical protein KT99_00615 [Shewanella benthica KT99]
MDRKNTAKRQHYVPRLLLKRFADSKELIWVFDKWEKRVFKSSIKGVAAETYYYNFEVSGVEYSLEDKLTEYESKASKIIDSIVDNNSLSNLTEEDKYSLSEFISIQYLRTPYAFNQSLKLHDHLMGELLSRGISPEQVEGYQEPTEYSSRLWRMSLLSDFDLFTQNFFNKTWLLQASSAESQFWISDNPISFQSTTGDEGERGKIGLEVDGIEVYLPLTKDLTLVLWCGNRASYLCESFKSIEEDYEFRQLRPEQFESIENLYHCIKKGKVMASTKDNVTNVNSLQVKYSSRFIFSSSSDFSLAEEMIDSEPH